jgi:D-alanine transaminase
MPAALANLNGVLQPLANVMVPALDRGFLFGDAVYEAMHIVDGKPRFIERHLARLERSLRELRIGPIDLERLKQRITETIAAGPFVEAFVYIQISRGAASTRSHAFPPPGTVPTEFLFVESFSDPYKELRNSGAAAITHPDLRWHRCDVKSTNLLGNVLACQACKEKGAYEALLVRPDGTITEGTRTSLFGVVNGTLRTGPLSGEILPGITRQVVLELVAELKLPVQERHLTVAELPSTTELFLTGTTSEVLPIVLLDGKAVGAGTPGPMTKSIQKAFAAKLG